MPTGAEEEICGRVMAMRRAQAILVVLALVALPASLLARSGSCAPIQCACCLIHISAAQHGKHTSHSHCTGQTECGMTSGADYALIAPIAPAIPGALAVVAAPSSERQPVRSDSPLPTQGFVSALFEPPRA
jgi:hypothetical protein